MPCPISTCGMVSVTVPSRSMRMKALGTKPAFDGVAAAALARGTWKPTTNALAPTAPISARPDGRIMSGDFTSNMFGLICGMFDGVANPNIGPATADVSRHGGIDVGIFGVRNAVEQRRGGHDLTGLAVAALYDFQIEP